ncbi:Clp protease N-terminal domain-containing protein [Kitasatospora sp. NPDC127111]|uniref:Clp protease N-terminal domain-containing protein n=1 Tax=Kitasatospora sp. NPDC127111 TaxID=3345363 RepID=UPI003628EA96
MFERFTDHARQIIVLAQEEARMRCHQAIDTEHLLLGLTHQQGSSGVRTLEALGISLEAVRRQVAEHNPQGREPSPTEHIPFTTPAKKVLEMALREALLLNHNYIGTEHLLLGLIREHYGLAARILIQAGADLDRTRERVTAVLTGPPPIISPPSLTPLLDGCTRDLGREAGAHELAPVIGRTDEIERIARVLSRHRRNVPLLVGDPGVGKASVVSALAHAIAAGNAPATLAGRSIRSLDAGILFTDPQHQGRFAALMSGLLREVQRGEGVILFLNHAFTVLHAANGRAAALAFFRPLLGTPGVAVIAACTTAEYRRRDPDPGLDLLLQRLEIAELPDGELQEVLVQARPRLERHHGVVIADEALRASVELARERLPGQALPGSAIDLLDQASAVAGARRADAQVDPVAEEYEERIAQSRRHADSARASQDGQLESHYEERIEHWSAALALHRRTTAEQVPARRVTAAEVTEALALLAGLPQAPVAEPVPHDPYVWTMS